MKLAGRQVEAFMARPDPAVATVLVYGPDAGLVAQRARDLARKVVDDLDDPFRVTELAADDLKDAPGRLVEEAQALCLMGGRRLVRVRHGADLIAPAVRDLLALPDQAGFVVIEAGELGSGSKLRRLVEDAKRAAALPCYREEAAALGETIRQALEREGLTIEPAAMDHLTRHLGGDRLLTQREVEKLALYMADAPERRVRLEDAAAVVGDSAALDLDDIVHAAILGDAAKVERGLARLLAEGGPPQRVLRAAANVLMRLLRLQAEVSAGTPAMTAIKAARPPIFWKLEGTYAQALRRWSACRLLEGLALLQEAETRCRTGQPEPVICRAALASLIRLPGPARG